MSARIRLKDMPLVLVNNFLAGANTYMAGRPGIGKSMTIEDYATKMQARMPEFQFFRFYAPTMSPMDIVASAPDYDRGTLKLYVNEALPNAYRDPDLKGAIFFGELPNADPATLKLLQKYINGEDMSGCLRKPEGIVVIADGNRLEDRSGVQQQGRAFMSRFEQVEVYTTADDNVEHAAKHNFHPHVQTFFRDNPALIDNYDEVFETGDAVLQRGDKARSSNGNNQQTEEGRRGVWANMRSWERISNKEFASEKMNRAGGVTQSEIGGNVGTAVAAQYEAHRKILGSLTSFTDIMADPANAPIPEKMDEQYMLAMLVGLRCSNEQLGNVRVFGQRMPKEMQALMLTTLTKRNGKGIALTSSSDYLKWISDTSLTALIKGV